MSLYGTLCLLKSVVNSDSARAGGRSSGSRVGVMESPGGGRVPDVIRDREGLVGTGVLVTGVLPNGDMQAARNNKMTGINLFGSFILEVFGLRFQRDNSSTIAIAIRIAIGS